MWVFIWFIFLINLIWPAEIFYLNSFALLIVLSFWIDNFEISTLLLWPPYSVISSKYLHRYIITLHRYINLIFAQLHFLSFHCLDLYSLVVLLMMEMFSSFNHWSIFWRDTFFSNLPKFLLYLICLLCG